MRLRGQTTTFQTRLEISEYAAAGWDDPQIATAVGCSVWTVRKWRRRWRKLGRVGFTSQMGRPVTGPMSTFPYALKEAILHLRKLHPGWGPATLLTALKTDSFW
ncbi:MAG: helix-turn-helix domain-containing protein [Ktedonobacteraceae bacterium]